MWLKSGPGVEIIDVMEWPGWRPDYLPRAGPGSMKLRVMTATRTRRHHRESASVINMSRRFQVIHCHSLLFESFAHAMFPDREGTIPRQPSWLFKYFSRIHEVTARLVSDSPPLSLSLPSQPRPSSVSGKYYSTPRWSVKYNTTCHSDSSALLRAQLLLFWPFPFFA